jgi:opacity protein-like surface antigen
MKKMKTTIAATVVLAACVSAGLLAADTNATITPNPPNLSETNGPVGNGTLANGWYGTGYDGATGYFNPARSDEYNPYPFYNIVGGESFDVLYEYNLPDQNESPLNSQAALTRHGVTAPRLKYHMSSLNLRKKAAQAAPTRSPQNLPPAAN